MIGRILTALLLFWSCVSTSQAAVTVMRQQGLGGDIVNIASKNGLVAGPNNVAYGTAKAAQLT